jgi:hypothetical protein
MEIFGVPGSTWILFAAPLPANLSVPPYGTVFIDPFSAVELGAGIVTPSGSSIVSFPVPNVPSITGGVLHWQAGFSVPPFLTSAETTIFVAP